MDPNGLLRSLLDLDDPYSKRYLRTRPVSEKFNVPHAPRHRWNLANHLRKKILFNDLLKKVMTALFTSEFNGSIKLSLNRTAKFQIQILYKFSSAALNNVVKQILTPKNNIVISSQGALLKFFQYLLVELDMNGRVNSTKWHAVSQSMRDISKNIPTLYLIINTLLSTKYQIPSTMISMPRFFKPLERVSIGTKWRPNSLDTTVLLPRNSIKQRLLY